MGIRRIVGIAMLTAGLFVSAVKIGWRFIDPTAAEMLFSCSTSRHDPSLWKVELLAWPTAFVVAGLALMMDLKRSRLRYVLFLLAAANLAWWGLMLTATKGQANYVWSTERFSFFTIETYVYYEAIRNSVITWAVALIVVLCRSVTLRKPIVVPAESKAEV